MDQHLNFSWRVFNFFDRLCACYIMIKGPLLRRHKIFRLFWLVSYILVTGILLSTAIKYHEDMSLVVISACSMCGLLTAMWSNFKFIKSSEAFNTIFSWLMKVETVSRKNNLSNTGFFVKLTNFLIPFLFFSGNVNVLIIFIMGCVMPGVVFPKFKAPLPFYLPFENQESWFIFVSSSFIQWLGTYIISSLACFGICMFVALYKGCSAHINDIILKVEDLKHSLLRYSKYKKRAHTCLIKKIPTIINMVSDANR